MKKEKALWIHLPVTNRIAESPAYLQTEMICICAHTPEKDTAAHKREKNIRPDKTVPSVPMLNMPVVISEKRKTRGSTNDGKNGANTFKNSHTTEKNMTYPQRDITDKMVS